MPNWCANELVITGDRATRETLNAQVGGGDTALSFANIVPPPDSDAYRAACSTSIAVDGCGLVVNEETGKYDPCDHGLVSAMSDPNNWYNWNVQHWGTKWDTDAEMVVHDNISTVYRFDTAWAPPVPVIEALAAQYPTLEFSLRYAEAGMGYIGEVILANGRTVNAGEWEREASGNTIEVESWHGDQMFVNAEYFDNGMRIWGTPEFLTLGG